MSVKAEDEERIGMRCGIKTNGLKKVRAMINRMKSGLVTGHIKRPCLAFENTAEGVLREKTKQHEKVSRESPVRTLNSEPVNSNSAYCLGNLIIATRFRDRLLGFLAKRPKECTLLISPCNAIHTFGIKGNLDIAFFDDRGKVLLAQRNIPPGKIIRCLKARGVLEKFSHIDKQWFCEGDEVKVYV